jgi:hypothetical protein
LISQKKKWRSRLQQRPLLCEGRHYTSRKNYNFFLLCLLMEFSRKFNIIKYLNYDFYDSLLFSLKLMTNISINSANYQGNQLQIGLRSRKLKIHILTSSVKLAMSKEYFNTCSNLNIEKHSTSISDTILFICKFSLKEKFVLELDASNP